MSNQDRTDCRAGLGVHGISEGRDGDSVMRSASSADGLMPARPSNADEGAHKNAIALNNADLIQSPVRQSSSNSAGAHILPTFGQQLQVTRVISRDVFQLLSVHRGPWGGAQLFFESIRGSQQGQRRRAGLRAFRPV